ncbi:hypothetical protein EJ04DRAFT_145361 [Polyplosphaeria fusca]|uniref:Exonuclease V n=1 Tax=Polyplosphaeria fusca TaxID=682080 RepID=A0A9P4QJ09_9PLEO|nr:hypothetical protein EJ04DRAFT_145361 [Polyplosphaeria fusca]
MAVGIEDQHSPDWRREHDLMTARRGQHAAMPSTRPQPGTPPPEEHGMALSREELNASSDYGSDVEVYPGSEYGSEFDEEEVTQIGDLLSHIAATAPVEKTVIVRNPENGNGSHLPTVLIHQSPPSAVVRLGGHASQNSATPLARHARSPSVEVAYDSRSRDAWSVLRERVALNDGDGDGPIDPAEAEANSDDTRTPLERFRTKPRKPLSVTDLVSPAWCELQYWYNLTKFGRKPPTEAMRQGSRIHKTLEEEIREVVKVKVQSKEDRFGLRIWNVVQGLRTLRATGLTRELEVWGVVDGLVVNGVIDEITYTCPDPSFEDSIERSKTEAAKGTLPIGQLSIEHVLKAGASGGSIAERVAEPPTGTLAKKQRVAYVSDCKTRGTKRLPIGASLRPAWMQLMLYRRLLESLALNTVDAVTIFSRYNIRSLEPFTDMFVAEVEALGQHGEHKDEGGVPLELQTSEIRNYRNPSALWSLMIAEFQQSADTISHVLRAEFRWAKTGEVIGSEVIAYDEDVIEEYIVNEISWWRGHREAKGVEVEEAFKCRMCDFADECTWRKAKVEEALEKHRLRAATSKASV